MDIEHRFKNYDITPGVQAVLRILVQHVNYDKLSGAKVGKNTLEQQAGVASNAGVRNYISRLRKFVSKNDLGRIATITYLTSETEYQFRFTEDQKDSVMELQSFLAVLRLDEQLRERDEVTLAAPGMSKNAGTIIGKDNSRWIVDIDSPIHVSPSYLKIGKEG